jgi:hypothetical protein
MASTNYLVYLKYYFCLIVEKIALHRLSHTAQGLPQVFIDLSIIHFMKQASTSIVVH